MWSVKKGKTNKKRKTESLYSWDSPIFSHTCKLGFLQLQSIAGWNFKFCKEIVWLTFLEDDWCWLMIIWLKLDLSTWRLTWWNGGCLGLSQRVLIVSVDWFMKEEKLFLGFALGEGFFPWLRAYILCHWSSCFFFIVAWSKNLKKKIRRLHEYHK